LDMRKKYLADGLYSLISIMISLLAYGKHAVITEGNAGNTYCRMSEDRADMEERKKVDCSM
jgi:hypothetical protein